MRVAGDPIRVLAIARMELSTNRGTPIRVRSILERLATDTRFELMVASRDVRAPFGRSWVPLGGRFRDLSRIVSYVRSECIDLVIGHTLSSWFLLVAVRFFTRAKIMLEMHGFPEEESKIYGGISWWRYRLDRFVYGCTFRMCDLITTCSETAAERIRAYNPRTIAVYGGADIASFNPSVIPEARESDARIRIGYVGNGRVWQGVPFLLEMYQRYLASDPSLELAVLLSEQKGLSIPKGVTVHPAVEHDAAPRFLASCDILVIPRPQNEVNRLSFPSKLIEYMAMGKPVVASRTSDAHRIITDGVDGLLFDPGDMDGFVRAIQRLKDPVERARIGSAAADTVARAYTWDHQVGIIAKAIEYTF
jgi:glycosyltransferase involved in cell wall biosynthesis